MRTWMCLICGWVYDEEAGLPDEGSLRHPLGRRAAELGLSRCGARKEDFELMEI